MTSRFTSFAMGLYSSVAVLLAPVAKHHLKKRIQRGKEHPVRYREKLGHSDLSRPQGRLIWVHGASVGESLSILPLIETMHKQQSGLRFLVTTGTATSAKLMEERLPSYATHQFVPIDLPSAVEHFLNRWSPDIGIIVESELWPQLIFRAKKHGIPLALINARMSKNSTASWKRAPFFIKDLLDNFSLILAQSNQDKQHFQDLGATNVKKSSNLKFAAPALTYKEDEFQRLRVAIGTRPMWFASSTHKGEEIFFAAFHKKLRDKYPDLLCIIAPRHPDRRNEIIRDFQENGISYAQRSFGDPVNADTSIYLADTLGELGLFYALSPIVVIGGSFLRKGGQNLLEPARLGCAIICGPEMQNFEEICDDMRQAQATVKLKAPDHLHEKIDTLLANQDERYKLSLNAMNYVDSKGQEIDLIAAQLLSLADKPD